MSIPQSTTKNTSMLPIKKGIPIPSKSKSTLNIPWLEMVPNVDSVEIPPEMLDKSETKINTIRCAASRRNKLNKKTGDNRRYRVLNDSGIYRVFCVTADSQNYIE